MKNKYFQLKKSASGKKCSNKQSHDVTARLDESVPLETECWLPVKQLLAHLTEFAPDSMLVELSAAIASYADDQARLGYILGQEDLVKELSRKAA